MGTNLSSVLQNSLLHNSKLFSKLATLILYGLDYKFSHKVHFWPTISNIPIFFRWYELFQPYFYNWGFKRELDVVLDKF